MEQLKRCLICYVPSESEESIGDLHIDNSCFGNTGKLAEETLIVFVVRRLLKVPRSVCTRFLKELGSPSDWCLTFCGNCEALLNDAREVAKMIYNLEGKLNGLRNKIKNEVTTSYREFGKPPRRNYYKHLEALDEIRYCVIKGFDDRDNEEDHSEKEEFEADFHDQKSDNDGYYSDGDFKGNIKINSAESDTGKRRSSRLRLLRPRFQKPKPIKAKKEIKSELYKTIIPEVIPLNNSLKNESVDVSELQSSHSDLNIQETEDVLKESSLVEPDFPGAGTEKNISISSYDDLDEDTEYWHVNDDPDNSSDDNKQGKETTKTATKMPKDSDNTVQETIEQRYLKLVASARFRAERKPDGKRMRQRYNDDTLRPFKCSMCKWRYSTELLLQGHINRVHKGLKKNFTCELCKKGFDRRSRLEKHLRGHVNRTANGISTSFACSQCSAQFSSKIRLDIHVQKTHLGNQKPIACQQCNRKFDQLCRLEKHLREAHEMTLKSNDGYLHKRDDGETIRKKKKYKCPKCVRSFDNEDVRHSHIQRKHNGVANPYPCSICEKGFIQKTMLDAHLRRHERKINRQFICELCGKHFKHAFRLKYHVAKVHENRYDFICEICSKLYKTKKSLTHHQATMHLNVLGVTHFDCDQCNRTFGTPGGLKNHVDQIHNDIYPFRCSYCNKGFTNDASKTDHENTHAGVKPHMCEICGRSFAWRKHLDVHKRIHTGEKPYHCDTCGQDFRDRTWFKRHQELHTGIIHNCHICGKGFPIKHNLGIHMKSHANKNGRNNKQMQNPNSTIPEEGERKNQTKKHYESESETSDIDCGNTGVHQFQRIYS